MHVSLVNCVFFLPFIFYPKLEKPRNSSRNNFVKISKKTSHNITKHRISELLSSSVSFSFTSRQFPAFLNCYKSGEPSKSKFALNSIFTILPLAGFFLSTVDLFYVLYVFFLSFLHFFFLIYSTFSPKLCSLLSLETSAIDLKL